MTGFTIVEIRAVLPRLAQAAEAAAGELNAADGKLGDGDLGVTILTSLASEWSFARAVCPAVPMACATPGKGLFSVKQALGDPSATKLIWKWLKGSAGDGAFGDPTTGSGFTVCVYDGGALVESHSVIGGGNCSGAPCWKTAGATGFKYKNPAGNDDGITKEYLAIVAGKPPARGTIDLALDRDPWDARRVTVRDRGGVPSVTRFRRVRSVEVAPGRILSLVVCQLVTGRMHQIRVHLAAKGWPIVGDLTYGVKVPDLDRQALHASRIAFCHAQTGARVDVTAPPPEDMAALLRLFDAGEPGEDRAER